MKVLITILGVLGIVLAAAGYCTLLDMEERCKYEDFEWDGDDYYG